MSSSSSSWQQQHPGAEAAAAAAGPRYAAHKGIPGVRFVPSDQELILDYLLPKIQGKAPRTDLVHEADVYAKHPKDLTRMLGKSEEDYWYVFSPRNRKYAKGKRPSRSTGNDGRWKAVGKNLEIRLGPEGKVIGHKCGLAYELFVRDGDESSRPRTVKTEWKMCEFVAEDTNKPISSENTEKTEKMLLNDCVLCRITRKAAAGQELVLEDQGQAAVVEEPDEEEQVQNALLPPDPSQQQARAQVTPLPYLLHDGADGTEVGAEGVVDADLEPPPPPRDGDDGGAATEVHFVDWTYQHPEPWGDDGYGVAYDHDQWNQFGAATDPDPMVSQFQVPADPIELPSDPQPWDVASTLLFADDGHELVEDEVVKADDDIGKDGDTAAKKTPAPANADSDSET